MDNYTLEDRSIQVITASKNSKAALTEAARVFKPSDIKVESLDSSYRMSDGEKLTLNKNAQLHVLVGKNGEFQCTKIQEFNEESSIVIFNNLNLKFGIKDLLITNQ